MINSDQATATEKRHLGPLQEHEKQLSIAEINEHAVRLESEFANHARAIYDGPNGEFVGTDPTTHPVELIADEVIAEFGEGYQASIGDVYLGIRNRLQQKLSAEVFEAMVPHIDGAIHAEAELKKLNEQYGETMRTHRDSVVQQVVTHVDWDRMIDTLVAKEWPAEAALDQETAYSRMRVLTDSDRSQDITGAHIEAKALEQLIDLARSINGMRDQPLTEAENGWFVHGNLNGAIRDWTDSSEVVLSYMSGQRSIDARFALRDAEVALAPWEEITRRLHMTADNTALVPAPIAEVCEHRIAAIMQQFYIRDQEIIRQEMGARPNALHIGHANQDLLRRNAGIDDVPGWINKRLNRFGHRLSRGIGFIEFTDGDVSHEATHDDDPRATTIAGERVTGQNMLRIDVRTGKRELHLSGPYTIAEDTSAELVRNSINRTFDHEVAHHIHDAMLTADELRQWHETLEAEPDYDIDDYIRTLVDQGAPDERLRWEQFAVSVEMYMNNPLLFADKYPRRFATLNPIVKRYDATEFDTLLEPVRALRQQGNNDDANRYLLGMQIAHARRHKDD